MCGLIGALSQRSVTPLLLEGLKRLEYRGYDSAGVAYLQDGAISVRRRVGKVAELEAALGGKLPDSAIGIGHTRWATHGEPEERNAHPHVSRGEVAVVHNGIIENYEGLRQMLEQLGYEFQSDTDTEAVAHLIHHHSLTEPRLFEAVRAAVGRLQGSYAIAVMSAREPDCLIAARRGNPLAVGIADGALYVASDATALLPYTKRFVFLEDGDIACLRAAELSLFDSEGRPVRRAPRKLDIAANAAEKGPYRHYMLKEIHEQPDALADTLQSCAGRGGLLAGGPASAVRAMLKRIKAVHIVACGTSHHAGEVARYWLEREARLPCMVDLASEYRYRSPVVPPDCLFVALSQSGETADTLAALRYAGQAGYAAKLAVCNVPASTLVREADACLLTRAGPEIGVASTKAFTTQLLCMRLLTGLLAQDQAADAAAERALVERLRRVSGQVEDVLNLNRRIAGMAEQLVESRSALFLGRGAFYPIAREGALKLKEISYIHAEAYAAGELKHGPLALVDALMPLVALAPNDELLPKLRANLHEVQARKGRLYLFADREAGFQPGPRLSVIKMPSVDPLTAPIAYTVALQLLAYHVAVLRGNDVDKPRNLAKSVTVE